jgi:hypothetical protein
MIRCLSLAMVLLVWPCYADGQETAPLDGGDASVRAGQMAEAQQKFRLAVVESHYETRIENLTTAIDALEDCLKLKFDHEDERQHLVRAVATARYELAKTYWPPNMWDRFAAMRHHQPGFANEQYLLASERFAEAAAHWSAKLGKLPQDRKLAIKQVLGKHADYAELFAAEGDHAACLRGLACIKWAYNEPDAKKAVKAAVDACRKVRVEYAITLVGAHTGLRGAEVLLTTGDAKGALELTETVLESVERVYSLKPESIADLRFSAERLRMLCWSDAAIGQQDQAIEFGEAWLDQQTDKPLVDDLAARMRPVEMRALVAFAYFMRWKSAAADERDDKDRETAWDHAIWIERRHRGNETARRVLREIDLEMLKVRMK